MQNIERQKNKETTKANIWKVKFVEIYLLVFYS
jgi:hypothetical protein